ncbi:MAG: helix-turn-helix transcriptional regulator [Lawsonibacter sp.]|nr:helix-turn-helix transcriptional regulator [Lawsonibacter sp.]
MLKFNNTWETNPHMTQLLETEIYERRRRTKSISQLVLANKIGVSRNCIYLIESHDNIPKIETILDIIQALGFSEEERKAFMGKYTEAYYKDKEFQQEREKEMAGALWQLFTICFTSLA